MEQVHVMDGAQLKAVMRHVPSPVTVLTTAMHGEIRGATIGSFTSVSLDPPLISFNVQHGTQMHDALVDAPWYTVHILADTQAYLSNHFAIPNRSGDEQFASVPHHLDANGIPVLDESLAVLACRAYRMFEAGDHTVCIGEVIRVEAPDGEAQPLIYFDRSYRAIGNEVQSVLLSSTNRGSNASE